jgi:hypothetical protein
VEGIDNGLNMNREHTTSENQDTPDNHLAELSCESNSISSLNSAHSQLAESEDPDSLREDDSDAQSQNSGLDSIEDNISCNSGDESIGQLVRVFCYCKVSPTEPS